MRSPEIALDARAWLGEGAIWVQDVLYWVDIERGEVHRFDPTTGHDDTLTIGMRVGSIAPRRAGGLVVAAERGVGSIRGADDGFAAARVELLVDPERDLPNNRFNDGKCSPDGYFFAGSQDLGGRAGRANLWRIHPDFWYDRVLGDLDIVNGPAWSPSGEQMFINDTPQGRTLCLDYEPGAGRAENPRALLQIPHRDGRPDGMTVDAEGGLWICLFGAGAVGRWDTRTGQLLDRIELPTPHPTSLAFGGPDLQDLYITTANVDEEGRYGEAERPAGAIFVCRPGVQGLPAASFAG